MYRAVWICAEPPKYVTDSRMGTDRHHPSSPTVVRLLSALEPPHFDHLVEVGNIIRTQEALDRGAHRPDLRRRGMAKHRRDVSQVLSPVGDHLERNNMAQREIRQAISIIAPSGIDRVVPQCAGHSDKVKLVTIPLPGASLEATLEPQCRRPFPTGLTGGILGGWKISQSDHEIDVGCVSRWAILVRRHASADGVRDTAQRGMNV